MFPPTPPSSSHRRDKDKENKFFEGPSTRSVTWDDEPEIHTLSTPLKPHTIPSKRRPSARHSILKKSNLNAVHLVPIDPKQRQYTPEPNEILRNGDYLTRPLSQIISVQDPNSAESLATLIEGYHLLAARLRSANAELAESDSSWPLFEPLRQNTEAFVAAVIRDLGRALVDPLSLFPVAMEKATKFVLPSPEKSPTRKKDGMTGEQVKYARDLCTTCHSVIRALSVILALPGFYKFFDEKQLRQILAAILAIPLADELPTPNARKTCALAIWLIQVQRLPATVLQPAADRIAYALRRGLHGELGKEGKKGSTSDGLKAICDLCAYLPEVFIPAFVPIVPSILSNLLANTLSLRTQACQALGGLVLGLTSLPPSCVHTRVSSMVASYLTPPPTPSGSDSSKKATEAAIVRTLRATMSQGEPEQPAQGPVWALCVLASFVVLLNNRLCTNLQANRTLCDLLSQGLRHKKSSVRALTCLAWRCLSWAYLQPPLPVDTEEESEVDEEIKDQTGRTKRAQCTVMLSVLECQTGIVNIAALLGDPTSRNTEEPLLLSLELLKSMAAKSGHLCYDATQTMMQMVSSLHGEQDEQDSWNHNLLLPKSLFSTSNSLFTTEYKNLTQAIRPLFENLASVGDVRPLTREELTRDWVLVGLMTAWKSALGHLELSDEADLPPELVATWAALLAVNVAYLEENGDASAVSRLGLSFMKYVTDILQDPNLNLTPNGDLKGVGPANRANAVPDSDGPTPVITGSTTCTNGELRLRVVRRMWNAMKNVFSKTALVESAEVLLTCLMRNARLLLTENAQSALNEEGEQERNSWVTLCMNVSQICGSEAMRVFWRCEEDALVNKVPEAWEWDWTKEFTNAVWKSAVETWRGDWEGAIVLLGVPFTDRHAWNLTSEDFSIWEEFLGYTTDQALDHGVDSPTVLDNVSFFVSSFQTPGAQSYLSIRLADLLLSHLDIPELRTVPQNLVDFISGTMRANYPPETQNKAAMRWLARSLMTLIEKCPTEFCLQILLALEDGIALWLADEHWAWKEDELNYDMIPLYQLILITIQGLPDPVNVLCAVGDVVGSVFSYRTPSLAVQAFVEFWTTSGACISAPAGGWPDSVSRTLRTVGLIPEDDLFKPGALAPSLSPKALPCTPPSAVFKPEGLSRIPSPRRPQKVFPQFPSMRSPLSPTIRRQHRIPAFPVTPLTKIQICEKPRYKRKSNSGGKENLDIDNRPLASLAERIAEILNTNGTLLKKRKREDYEEQDSPDSSPISSPISTPSKRMKERMKPKQRKSNLPSESLSALVSSTLNDESEEELRCVEEASKAFSASDFPSRHVDRVMPRSKFVYGRLIVGDQNWSHNATTESMEANQARDALRMKKIDLNEILKSRSTIKRSSSAPQAMWNAIESRKRKWSDSDSAKTDGLTKTAPPPKRYCGVRPRRTSSMPECLDSDSTVVEIPLMSKTKLDVIDLSDSDDSLPASDDTVVSYSSEKNSPTKDALNRHSQKTSLQSRLCLPV